MFPAIEFKISFCCLPFLKDYLCENNSYGYYEKEHFLLLCFVPTYNEMKQK